MRRLDVSIPIGPGMPSFPGEVAFRVLPEHQMARGDRYNSSIISLGTHAGTHVDPPRHLFADGAPTDRLDLDQLNGPCVVVPVDGDATSVGPAEIARIPEGAQRVLFRSINSDRWRTSLRFFGDYVALAEDGAEALLGLGVRLVGIDALSIESDLTGRYPVHRRLLEEGVAILEGLLLGDVAPGPYELECLPLRLVEGDGGPARAVLRVP